MCCGGRRRRVSEVKNGQVVTKVVEDAMGQPVYMQYTGNRKGGFSVTGTVSRRSYRINRNSPIFVVDSDDAEDMARLPDFRIVSKMPSQPVVTVSGISAAEQVAQQITARFAAQPQTNVLNVPNVPPRMQKRVRGVDERGTSKPNLSGF